MKTITYIISILAGIVVVIFIAGLTSRMNANINGLVSEKYVIEDYVGLRADDVVPILKEYGINVVQNIVNDDILPSGYIVSQNVEAGTSIKKGDKLQIEVSGGEGDFVLEDYKNEDYRLVEQALNQKECIQKYELPATRWMPARCPYVSCGKHYCFPGTL